MTNEEFETYRFSKKTKIIVGGGDWVSINGVDYSEGIVLTDDFMSPYLGIKYQDITAIKD
jgi:hypothetical protein